VAEGAGGERNGPEGKGRGLGPVILFAVIAAALLAAAFLTHLGEYCSKERVQALAEELGVWGPVVILAAGLFTPLIFLPRWPIAFVAGLLYGILAGTALSTVASTLGAWLNFWLARTLLAPAAARLRRRPRFARLNVPPDKEFIVIFLLRAFPFSNFAITNLLAGALNLRTGSYLLATFLGMIPMSLMYAAWGKLLQKPSAEFYWIAAFTLVLILAGTWWAKKRVPAWFRRWGAKAAPKEGGDGAPAPGGGAAGDRG